LLQTDQIIHNFE